MADQMQRHVGDGRDPDWFAAIVAGLGAGAILMVVDLLWSTMVNAEGPWVTSRMIAAAVLGPQLLESSTFNLPAVIVALVAHYSSGVVFAVLVAYVSTRMRLDTSAGLALLTGAVAGLLLYLFNFYVLVHLFPWFAQIRGLATIAAHLIFGASATLLYWKLQRRPETAVATHQSQTA